MAGVAADVLAEQLQTEVSIGSVRLGLFNRLVLDDVNILDQNGDPLLNATRMSAKVNLLPMFKGQIRIASIQLFGYEAHLRRRSPDEPYTFQFIIDNLSSKSEEEKPIDLAISTIVARRGTLHHEVMYRPEMNRFDPFHATLENLSLKASIHKLTNNDIDIELKDLSFVESRSGLTLSKIHFRFTDNHYVARLSDFELRLPQSVISISELTSDHNDNIFHGAQGNIIANLHPDDVAPLLPEISGMQEPIHLDAAASFADDTLCISHLQLNTEGLQLSLNDVHAEALSTWSADSLPMLPVCADISLRLESVFCSTIFNVLDNLPAGEHLSPTLRNAITALGNITCKGSVDTRQPEAAINLALQTDAGSATVRGTLADNDILRANIEADGIKLAHIIGDKFPLAGISLKANAEGSLKRHTGQISLNASDINIKGVNLDRFDANVLFSERSVNTHADLIDPDYGFHLETALSSDHTLDLKRSTLLNLLGTIEIDDLHFIRGEERYDLGYLNLLVDKDEEGHHFSINADCLEADINIDDFEQLVNDLATNHSPFALKTLADFYVKVHDADSLLRMTGLDLRLPQPATFIGSLNAREQQFSMKADLPNVQLGKENIRTMSLILNGVADSIDTYLTLQRMLGNRPIDVELKAKGPGSNLLTDLSWDAHTEKTQQGKLSVALHLPDFKFKQFDIDVLPTRFTVADSVWTLYESHLAVHDGKIDVHDFSASQGYRHLLVNGTASSLPTDTLHADVVDIDLGYILDLAKIEPVSIDGNITGHVMGHSLMSKPNAAADVVVYDFTINGAKLGTTYTRAEFNLEQSRPFLGIYATIAEPEQSRPTQANCLLHLGHGEGTGIDLSIDANHLNASFIQRYTNSIFKDLMVTASGHARLYGPFGALNIAGDLRLDTAAVDIPIIGTRYHFAGDSIHLYEGGFRVNDVTLYDERHGSDNRAHRAKLTGRCSYEHFRDISYVFDIEAEDMLCYDFRDFGDMSFYATVFATGHARISGQPGSIHCDLNGRPTAGTTLTYNVSTPETLTDNGFINFVASAMPIDTAATTTLAHHSAADNTPLPALESDINLNFELDVTPDAAIRLIMDPRTGDAISINGGGHLHATYYNKGRFLLYGQYTVERGTYRLSLQDVIRKDFVFQRGGTLNFNGAPLQAALDLQAVYTVPSVSLNDLAAGANISNSNVRVDCIMHISGRAVQPQISFDFDIPNVNEDEKQMVRSLISTDEERNLQVIYLLGIGRFYTYDYTAEQNQAAAAMNGLLSSTLSGQINNILSSAIGTNANWNFGTNLSTGQQGWNEVDVEGMLSGRLLNNRLLINGTFGYRDTPMANTNFIGDFDVQWLLTPSGTVSVKAYSETNDRYFTKTALTTQGVGIILRKDFNTLGELFRRRKK